MLNCYLKNTSLRSSFKKKKIINRKETTSVGFLGTSTNSLFQKILNGPSQSASPASSIFDTLAYPANKMAKTASYTNEKY
jgi:hypothetical protein